MPPIHELLWKCDVVNSRSEKLLDGTGLSKSFMDQNELIVAGGVVNANGSGRWVKVINLSNELKRTYVNTKIASFETMRHFN